MNINKFTAVLNYSTVVVDYCNIEHDCINCINSNTALLRIISRLGTLTVLLGITALLFYNFSVLQYQ